MDKNIFMTIVLAVLVIVAVVQTVQLFSLKSAVASGELHASTSTSVQQGAPSQSKSVPSNIQNLPSMVGGC